MKKRALGPMAVVAVGALAWPAIAAAQPPPKRLLAVGMSTDWQHESASDALVALYELGRDSGLWETTIRTDVDYVTKRELERNGKNLDHFDAVFFVTGGELPLDEEQKAALLSFVAEDGKGFIAAHGAAACLYEWPGYGELLGGYFDGHPWDQIEATLVVEDREFPAMRHFPARFRFFDEIYQIKQFSRDDAHVLMSLDPASVDLTHEGVHQTDFPVAWTRRHGKGRVFYSSLGHLPQLWARPDAREMWLEAVKWAMGLSE